MACLLKDQKKNLSPPIELTKQDCEIWMRKLLSKASEIGDLGEVPVSAVVLDRNGFCIGYGGNKRERERDPLGHAEIVALKQAALIKNDWRFNDCTLIVTLEPCPMCAGALVQARMGQVIFGAFDSKRGALGTCLDLSNHKTSHHHMKVIGGVMEQEAKSQLQEWFRTKRLNSI